MGRVLWLGAFAAFVASAPAAAMPISQLPQDSGIEQVRWVCTNYWNGRWHQRQKCHWVRDDRRRWRY